MNFAYVCPLTGMERRKKIEEKKVAGARRDKLKALRIYSNGNKIIE